jgi:hypothetical protein
MRPCTLPDTPPDCRAIMRENANQPCTQHDTIRMNPDRACATKLSLTKKACVPDHVKTRSGFFCPRVPPSLLLRVRGRRRDAAYLFDAQAG